MAILEPVLEPCWGGLAQASRLAEQGRVGAMQAGLGGGGGAVRGCSRAETEPNRGAAARLRLDWRRRGPGPAGLSRAAPPPRCSAVRAGRRTGSVPARTDRAQSSCGSWLPTIPRASPASFRTVGRSAFGAASLTALLTVATLSLHLLGATGASWRRRPAPTQAPPPRSAPLQGVPFCLAPGEGLCELPSPALVPETAAPLAAALVSRRVTWRLCCCVPLRGSLF